MRECTLPYHHTITIGRKLCVDENELKHVLVMMTLRIGQPLWDRLHRSPMNFPQKESVMCNSGVFCVLSCLNKLLNKRSSCRWFETYVSHLPSVSCNIKRSWRNVANGLHEDIKSIYGRAYKITVILIQIRVLTDLCLHILNYIQTQRHIVHFPLFLIQCKIQPKYT